MRNSENDEFLLADTVQESAAKVLCSIQNGQ